MSCDYCDIVDIEAMAKRITQLESDLAQAESNLRGHVANSARTLDAFREALHDERTVRIKLTNALKEIDASASRDEVYLQNIAKQALERSEG
jgi:hypothetical protein